MIALSFLKEIFTHAEEVRLKGFYAVLHSGNCNFDPAIVPLPLSYIIHELFVYK